MARYTFAGVESAQALAYATLGLDPKFLKYATATVTAWDAESGGTQITDLLLNSAPVTSIPVGSNGQIPQFEGPDGVTSMWLDGGAGVRALFLAIDVDIVEQAAAHEANAAAYAQDAADSAAAASSTLAGALQSANNLSDVASTSTALSNLGGVPTARTVSAGTGLTGGGDLSANRSLAVSYGTAAGTAAQGNDSRITGAAQKASNLSDLASASTARTNLGLGTAATQASTAFATAAQGTKADSALQAANNLSDVSTAAIARTNIGAASNSGGGRELTAALSATTGTCTGDCSAASWFTVTPTGNITLAFSNVPASGTACTVTVEVSQGGTVRTVTLPTGGVWFGTAPTQTASKKCLITCATRDGGTTWLCTGVVQA